VAEYSIFIRPDLLQQFWQVMADGGFITDAVAVIDTSRRTGRRVLVEAGGVRPRRGRGLLGRCLTFEQREEIALGRAAGESMRSIAGRLGRSPSTISRELGRNLDRQGRYRATAAHAQAYERASRPKPAKLATNLALRSKVEKDLEKKYSPEQIVGRLRLEFPNDPEMMVSTETIYLSLYVQSRGALKRELTACLRTGRAVRRPSRKVGQRKNRIPNMVNVSERPAEADDRAVPGHWEGDLIIGRRNLTAIGTLVERSSGYTMLLHLPDGYAPEQVRDVLAAKIKTLPDSARRTLTWDQGATTSPSPPPGTRSSARWSNSVPAPGPPCSSRPSTCLSCKSTSGSIATPTRNSTTDVPESASPRRPRWTSPGTSPAGERRSR